jgi:hypothetical protein
VYSYEEESSLFFVSFDDDTSGALSLKMWVF